MDFVNHRLIKNGKIESRLYQETILESAVKHNLLCVLPTGLGKTAIAVILSAYRFDAYPNSKIMILAPTKPLTEQHFKTFKEVMNLPESDFVLITGQIKPEKRMDLYQKAKLIFATPQTVKNDLENKRLSLEDVSLLVFDEAHHAVGDYAYPYIAKKYMEEAKHIRILGLTASPGGTKEKIKEIMKNLGIEKAEIRTENDYDVRPWVKEKRIEWVSVELPSSFDTIRSYLKKSLEERIESLRKIGFSKPSRLVTRRDLLELQKTLQGKAHGRSKYWGIVVASQAIKIEYALTLLETQGITSLHRYLKKLSSDGSKSSKSLMNDDTIKHVMSITSKLRAKGYTHPKMSKLCEIISNQLCKTPNSKIIIFANYRDMVKQIVNVLSNIENARPIEFMGQREGITQKEQKRRIQDFKDGKYNILVTTSVGEEGIDIPEMELAIFYEPVPSEIRLIQRRGRVGRTKVGRIIILLTKRTRDEAYYWTAHKKEKVMKKTLYDIRGKGDIKMKKKGQLKIEDFA